jgi:hypothetical protein
MVNFNKVGAGVARLITGSVIGFVIGFVLAMPFVEKDKVIAADSREEWQDFIDNTAPEDIELYLGVIVGECWYTAVPTDMKQWGDYSITTYNGSVKCSTNDEEGHSNLLITARFYRGWGKISWQMDQVFMTIQEHEGRQDVQVEQKHENINRISRKRNSNLLVAAGR